jgi:hypothetical protein
MSNLTGKKDKVLVEIRNQIILLASVTNFKNQNELDCFVDSLYRCLVGLKRKLK